MEHCRKYNFQMNTHKFYMLCYIQNSYLSYYNIFEDINLNTRRKIRYIGSCYENNNLIYN